MFHGVPTGPVLKGKSKKLGTGILQSMFWFDVFLLWSFRLPPKASMSKGCRKLGSDLSLQLIYNGQLLVREDDEKPLGWCLTDRF